MNKYTINQYYEKYSDKEILFNKNIKECSYIEPQKTIIKIGYEEWSCVLYTCSMKNAKVIMNLNKKIFETLRASNNNVTIKFSFNPPDEKKPFAFYISSKIQGYKNFNQEDANTYIVNIIFVQKPTDFLINTLGAIIDEHEKIDKRKDTRISLNTENLKHLGIESNNIVSKIDNIDRNCLVRNISASGAVVLLVAPPKLLINKKIILNLKIKGITFKLEGIINRYSEFLEKKALYEFGIQFEKENIPVKFIKALNEYFDKIE